MLTADTNLQMRTRLPPALGGQFHQLPNAVLIQSRKRILLQDSFRKIRRQNFVDVVSREPEGGLGEVVSAEGEELGFFCDLIGDQSSTWKFDHRANHVIDLRSLLFEDL